MKKLLEKKEILILCIIAILLCIGMLIYIFFIRNRMIFKLNGEQIITVEIYKEYQELGVKAILSKKDLSDQVVIDNSSVDHNTLGTYEVIYTLEYEGKTWSLKRQVEVVDNVSPTITLNGEETVIITEGEQYYDPGCNVVDNYDPRVKDKLQIVDNVNSDRAGIYRVKYVVTDQNNNQSEKIRTVIVKPKDAIETNEVDWYYELMKSNEIIDIGYIDDGIYIEGYLKEANGKINVKLCKDYNKNCIAYNMNTQGKYYYSGNIRLSDLNNGTYTMWVESQISERVINTLDTIDRIARAKLGDKLVTFTYEDTNYVKVEVEDFEYQYDILIDPGHGGSDPGAANATTSESVFNLVQSLYEKKRYEEHGLKVLMLREDESYGTIMGDSNWPPIRKKAYALGYYGVVSKITYSNHHNGSEDKSLSGWEIIVPAKTNEDDLKLIYQIRNYWEKSYSILENHVRIYTRNYSTSNVFTKENNEYYNFTDYYAVIRVPYELFHIKNILFEGAYLSNAKDFEWYYTNDNWKKQSEEKIKVFVTSLGVKYVEPDV